MGDHCSAPENLRRGVCETYFQIMETGSLLPFPSEMSGRRFHPSTSTFPTHNQHRGNADTEPELSPSYLKATLSIQKLPEMFKELVTSWKSTFDPSRTERNISFYFDDDDEIPQIHEKEKRKSPPPSKPIQKLKQYKYHSATAVGVGSSSSSVVVSSSPTSLNSPSPRPQSTRNGKNIPTLNQKRASTTFSAFQESHEYSAELEEPHLNSRIREIDHDSDREQEISTSSNSFLRDVPNHRNHDTTLTSNSNHVTGTLQQKDDKDISYQPLEQEDFSTSKPNQEIGSNRKKRFAAPSQQQQQSIGESDLRKNNPISQPNIHNPEIRVTPTSSSATMSSQTMVDVKKETHLKERAELNAITTSTPEKVNPKSGLYSSIISPNHEPNSRQHLASISIANGKRSSDHLKPLNLESQSGRGGKLNLSTSNRHPVLEFLRQKEAPNSATEDEKCLQSPTIPGPKKMIGFLQQEMFSRWQSLLETAEALINPSNLGKNSNPNYCIGEQLGSPDAGRIKMHIELKPFGPAPYQEAERRVKATQLVIFDSPWLSMIQLYSKLSGKFFSLNSTN